MLGLCPVKTQWRSQPSFLQEQPQRCTLAERVPWHVTPKLQNKEEGLKMTNSYMFLTRQSREEGRLGLEFLEVHPSFFIFSGNATAKRDNPEFVNTLERRVNRENRGK